MEIYSSSTRFALACNLSNKIIEPIQSRCALLRFGRLSDKQILQRLLEICQSEQVRPCSVSCSLIWSNCFPFLFNGLQVQYVPGGLEALIFTADGDMRQAVNNLQSTHSGFGLVNEENVFKVCDQVSTLVSTTELLHPILGFTPPTLYFGYIHS
jgi:replication factor C subunit 2/4